MATKKKSNTHNSTMKKPSSSAVSARTKKAASKRSQPATKTKTKSKKSKKNAERPAWLKKRDELTLKIFQWAYEANQRGEFQRF
jgi:hypothetical protein